MDRDTGKMMERDTPAPVSPATAVTRFRKPLVDYLISGLDENDKWVRILAADLLGSAGDPRAIEYLKPLLVDRDRDLRTISRQAMEMIQAEQVAVSLSLHVAAARYGSLPKKRSLYVRTAGLMGGKSHENIPE